MERGVFMSNKQDFLSVMKDKDFGHRVPLWELHFHLWKKYDDAFVSGPEFERLNEEEKRIAIKNDANIMKKVGEHLGFGGVSIPDVPWDCVYTLPQEYRVMLIRELKALSPDFCVVAGCEGVISMPSTSRDYMDFCFWIMDEPEEVDAHCEEMYERFKTNAMQLIYAGVDAIYIPADVADNRATFFNPQQLERWYFPYLKKCVDFLHGNGVIAMLHTDGNINSLLENLLDYRLDALQAIDPIAGMEITNVLNIFDGKIAVCGNLDCGLMLSGTSEQIFESAKNILLDCKGKKGLVFGNSNAVVLETPLDNYAAMVDAWKQYGETDVESPKQ